MVGDSPYLYEGSAPPVTVLQVSELLLEYGATCCKIFPFETYLFKLIEIRIRNHTNFVVFFLHILTSVLERLGDPPVTRSTWKKILSFKLCTRSVIQLTVNFE